MACHWLKAAPYRSEIGVASATIASATTAVVFQTHACETGPIYHQRQAGTERSNVAACEVKMVNAQNAVSLAIGCSIAAAAAVCSEFSEGRARTAIPDVTDRYVRS